MGFGLGSFNRILRILASRITPTIALGPDRRRLHGVSPKEGEESYPLWKEETERTHKTLRECTALMATHLNSVQSVSTGAMYLFPKIIAAANMQQARYPMHFMPSLY